MARLRTFCTPSARSCIRIVNECQHRPEYVRSFGRVTALDPSCHGEATSQSQISPTVFSQILVLREWVSVLSFPEM